MNPKSWATSKSIWLGAATTILGALIAAFEQYPMEPKTQGFILMGLGIAGIIARSLTDSPVTLAPPKKP